MRYAVTVAEHVAGRYAFTVAEHIAGGHTVTVADMCAGNGEDSGRHVRGRQSVAGMDGTDVDKLRHAELRRGMRHGRLTSDRRTVLRSELVMARRSGSG